MMLVIWDIGIFLYFCISENHSFSFSICNNTIRLFQPEYVVFALCEEQKLLCHCTVRE
ncbi:MAG: hypothetical protein UZ10_BCD003000033 [Bacteroidetes bacterium OLB10]|nr:MAG: hypothetical protein UZ10_BCD003000033 [Bacteroidetes bacterium OLB10]